MTPGAMCISDQVPKDGFVYPGELYEGIEMAFDTEVLEKKWPIELSAYGIEMKDLNELLKIGMNSYVTAVTEEILAKSQQMYDALCNGNLPYTGYRFYVLELLFLIKNGGLSYIKNGSLVTKGQRHIAVVTEITGDTRF